MWEAVGPIVIGLLGVTACGYIYYIALRPPWATPADPLAPGDGGGGALPKAPDPRPSPSGLPVHRFPHHPHGGRPRARAHRAGRRPARRRPAPLKLR
ncbi:MAG: hypothetical protein ACREPI_11985 [Candidatus Dormibacterales bacterium]